MITYKAVCVAWMGETPVRVELAQAVDTDCHSEAAGQEAATLVEEMMARHGMKPRVVMLKDWMGTNSEGEVVRHPLTNVKYEPRKKTFPRSIEDLNILHLPQEERQWLEAKMAEGSRDSLTINVTRADLEALADNGAPILSSLVQIAREDGCLALNIKSRERQALDASQGAETPLTKGLDVYP